MNQTSEQKKVFITWELNLNLSDIAYIIVIDNQILARIFEIYVSVFLNNGVFKFYCIEIIIISHIIFAEDRILYGYGYSLSIGLVLQVSDEDLRDVLLFLAFAKRLIVYRLNQHRLQAVGRGRSLSLVVLEVLAQAATASFQCFFASVHQYEIKS